MLRIAQAQLGKGRYGHNNIIKRKPVLLYEKIGMLAIGFGSKIQWHLDWVPSLEFEGGLAKTMDWHLQNETWLDNVASGNYQAYY